MQRIFIAAVLVVSFGGTPFAAESGSMGELLKKVADRYKNLVSYEIGAEEQIFLSQSGRTRSADQKQFLAIGKQGMFRVEQTSGDVLELRVSDGKNTWKALPKQKIWSRMQVARLIDAGSDEDTGEEPAPQDLLTETQSSLVTRYTGLARYADSATMAKDEKVKFAGGKVDCYVVRISTKFSKLQLFIAKDSLLVLRTVEKEDEKNGTEADITTEIKKFSEGMPEPQVFEFQPAGGSKEVADVSLPSERNLSWAGRPAADFTLKTLDGSAIRLADLKGKIVLLDFWATWCPPCRDELPTIERLSREYRDKNVLVFGVNDESPQTVKSFLGKKSEDLATLHDAQGKVHRLYGCYSIPTVMVINAAGTVVAHFVGERSESELVAALKQAGMR